MICLLSLRFFLLLRLDFPVTEQRGTRVRCYSCAFPKSASDPILSSFFNSPDKSPPPNAASCDSNPTPIRLQSDDLFPIIETTAEIGIWMRTAIANSLKNVQCFSHYTVIYIAPWPHTYVSIRDLQNHLVKFQSSSQSLNEGYDLHQSWWYSQSIDLVITIGRSFHL